MGDRTLKILGVIVFLSSLVSLSGCDIKAPAADQQFGQQNFVSAVALIELHKTRTGAYPDTLDDLQYLGVWDAIWLGAVEYTRVDDGYNLIVARGWVGEPRLSFPKGFKTGLGIKATNVTWLGDEAP